MTSFIMFLKNSYKFGFFLVLTVLIQDAFARRSSGFGGIATNAREPMEVVSAFISVGCLIVGVSCYFAAIVKYFEHRRSALAVPMSTVWWLFFLGTVLLLLPFIYILTGEGIPFYVIIGGSE